MANSRVARFIMEVTPSQYASIMRRRKRTTQMLDTIKEEDHREVSSKEFSNLSSSSKTASAYSSPANHASPAPGGAMASTINSKYFLREVQKSFSVFEH